VPRRATLCHIEFLPRRSIFGGWPSRCNTLQHTATHCNTLQRTATHCSILQHTAAHCNTLQHTARYCTMGWLRLAGSLKLQVSFAEYHLFYRALLQKRHIILRSLLFEATLFTATHCDTMQHTATRCSTLQHTATHCNTLQRTASHCNTLQHTAALCSTLQHTAAHCSTQQDTALWGGFD